MKKIISLFTITALCLTGLTGCQLANKDGNPENHTTRLAGVYITTDSLYKYGDIIACTYNEEEDSITPSDAAINGCYMATILTKPASETENADYSYCTNGIGDMNLNMNVSDTLKTLTSSTSQSNAFSENPGNTSTALSGTCYIKGDSDATYYLNTIYQKANGEIYITPADYTNSSADITTSIQETYSSYMNDTRHTTSSIVEIKITEYKPTDAFTFYGMSADNAILWEQSFKPAGIPESISLQDAAYVLVKTDFADGSVTYDTLSQLEDDASGEIADTYTCYIPGDSFYFIPQDVTLVK